MFPVSNTSCSYTANVSGNLWKLYSSNKTVLDSPQWSPHFFVGRSPWVSSLVAYFQQNQVILSDHPFYILAVLPYSPLAQLMWTVGNFILLTLFLWVFMQYLIAAHHSSLCVTSGPLFHPSWQAMHSTLCSSGARLLLTAKLNHHLL